MAVSKLSQGPLSPSGTDFSALPTPFRTPNSSSPSILVIGAGVSSLVSSWMLLDRAFKVTIVAKEFASFGKAQRLTSQIGGALLGISFCTMWTSHLTSKPQESPKLSIEFGVKLRKNLSCFPVPINTHDVESERVEAFQKAGIEGIGVADTFKHLCPVTDTDQAMGFLTNLVKSKGAQFLTETIEGDLREHEDELLEKHHLDAIVNASGLGARELASDPNVRPVRDGLLRIVNDGKDFEKRTRALVVNNTEPEDYNIVFIVPRNDNILILGTFIEFDEWRTD